MSIPVYFSRLKELYKSHLFKIGDIKFTRREIDVMSCVRYNKGEKKIANILLISHRTAGTHIHNIMAKIGVGSRDLIINFIEKSGKSKLLDEYYINLNIEMIFENKLRFISENFTAKYNDIILHNTNEISKKINLNDFKKHLKIAKINICSDEENTSSKLDIYCTKSLPNLDKDSKSVFINIDNASSQYTTNENIVSFADKANYYESVLKLIKVIYSDNKVKKQVMLLEQEIQEYRTNFYAGVNLTQEIQHSKFFVKKKYVVVCIIAFFICCSIVFTVLFNSKSNKQIKYDLILPHCDFLLKRPKVLKQISSIFKQNDIAIAALVGIGGSGKTTLARYYAKNFPGDIVWEINSETRKTIISSFEQLAYAMADTLEDKQQLNYIQNTPNITEKRKKLRIFLSTHIKKYKNWLLIYDNVNNLNDIMDLLPYDTEIWGRGKVLITTRDSNIVNNDFIPKQSIILMQEFDRDEIIELFYKIIGDKKTLINNDDLKSFIKEVPPFPLDIVTAASYIKNTNYSFKDYVKNISSPSYNLEEDQISFLKNIGIGHHQNTRNEIVSLSIKQLINDNDDFRDLVLLISILDNQNIPRSLLVDYKGESIVRKFLCQIRMFSFLNTSKKSFKSSFFSFHKTIQNISSHLLKKVITPEDYYDITKNQSKVMASYINKQNNKNIKFSQIKILENQAENFLLKTDLKHEDKIDLETELANCYLHAAKFYEAKTILEKNFKVAQLIYTKNSAENLKILSLLGKLNCSLSNYENAKKYLEEARDIGKNLFGVSSLEYARPLFYLAAVYLDLGQFSEAIKLFSDVQTIVQSHYGKNNINSVQVLISLASALYKNGDYDRAEKLLNETLNICVDSFGQNHYLVSEIYIGLGKLSMIRGNSNSAAELFNKSIKTKQKSFGENHILVIENKILLAKIYRRIGEYEKAIAILEKAIIVYRKKYGNNHRKTALIMEHMGDVMWNYGKIYDSIQLLYQSADIFTKNCGKNNILTAKCYLRLGYVLAWVGNYEKSKKYFEAGYETYTQYYQGSHIQKAWADAYLGTFYNKTNKLKLAQSYLEQALKVYQNQFGTNHKRINWIKIMLANTYKRQGNFKESIKFAEAAYDGYLKHYGAQHVKTILVLQELGNIYYSCGLKKGESLIKQAMRHLENKNSSSIFTTLEMIADIEFSKGQKFEQEGKIKRAQYYYKRSRKNYSKSLKSAKRFLPVDSKLIESLEEKLAKLTQVKI